jgi:hypothetical protein
MKMNTLKEVYLAELQAAVLNPTETESRQSLRVAVAR